MQKCQRRAILGCGQQSPVRGFSQTLRGRSWHLLLLHGLIDSQRQTSQMLPPVFLTCEKLEQTFLKKLSAGWNSTMHVKCYTLCLVKNWSNVVVSFLLSLCQWGSCTAPGATITEHGASKSMTGVGVIKWPLEITSGPLSIFHTQDFKAMFHFWEKFPEICRSKASLQGTSPTHSSIVIHLNLWENGSLHFPELQLSTKAA